MKTIKRRRLEGKTDYNTRVSLLKSDGRAVVRISNRLVLIQYVKSKESQDSVIIGANSKELLEYGWAKEQLGGLKSIPASYLTGYLLGIKLKDKDIKNAVLDIGLKRNSKGSRVFAAAKGLIDAGIEIPSNKEVFPDEKSIRRKVDIDNIKQNINKKFK